MRPPSHKPIPRTVSRPSNPEEPSFITSLPPEIRNRIYDVLFKRDVPVMLYADPDAFRMQEQYECDSVFCSSRCGSYHQFATSVNLFKTCRQVYTEAAGVLYGANHFIFDDDLSGHLNGYTHDHDHHHKYAARWSSESGLNSHCFQRFR
jgi:hypothetical protein